MDLGRLLSGGAYHVTGGRVGRDATPGFSATNVARTQLGRIADPNVNAFPVLGNPFNNPAPRQRNDGGGGGGGNGSQDDHSDGSTGGGGVLTSARAGGGGGGNDNAADIAALEEQERLLRQFIEGSGTQFNQGMTRIGDDYQRLVGRAGEQNSRALRDYAIKEEDTTREKQDALGRVDQNANVLNNSIRQRIGRSAGGSNSAMGVASNAVAREASGDRGEVLDSFGQNFRNLDIAKKDTEDDYKNLISDYDNTRNRSTEDFRRGFESQIQDAWGSIGDIQRQRDALRGGSVASIRAAGAGANAEVDRRRQTINSLFDQYRTPFQARDVRADAPALRDYVVGGSQVTQQQQQGGSTSPYARFLPQEDEQEKALF